MSRHGTEEDQKHMEEQRQAEERQKRASQAGGEAGQQNQQENPAANAAPAQYSGPENRDTTGPQQAPPEATQPYKPEEPPK